MKFCEKCRSYMRKTSSGFVCSKCGYAIEAEIVDVVNISSSSKVSVDVLDPTKSDYKKISRVCPKCGNGEVFHTLGLVSGEHAGVRQERSMERFTCTRCGHTWSD